MRDEIKEILEHQANMESLWCFSGTVSESLLQAALRHLTAELQGEPVMAKIAKDQYWHVDDELHSMTKDIK